MLACQKKLARTSDTPGRTRLVNYFDFGEFILADLPGYGYAKVSKTEKEKWGQTMEQFFADRSYAQYVFSLLDIRHPPTADDVMMVNFLHQSAIDFAFIATKADKLSRMQIKNNIRDIARRFAVPDSYIIPTSSETRQGKEEVLQKLEKVIAVLSSDEFNVSDSEDESADEE
jgi:GTP-binding protein